MTDPFLQIRSLRRRFASPRNDMVFEISVNNLDLAPGTNVLLVGPSGAGKTSLLLLAAGLDRPDSGTLNCFGQNIAGMSDAARALWRRKNVGFVYQKPVFVDYLTVWQNVAIKLVPDGVPHNERRAMAKHWLDQFEIGHLMDCRPRELSTGEQQRAAIARALIGEPQLVICDEATSNLDVRSRDIVISVLQKLRLRGATLFMVSHDPAFFPFADERYEMSSGTMQRQ